MKKSVLSVLMLAVVGFLFLSSGATRADEGGSSVCRDLPSHAALLNALDAAQAQANGGFGLQMWATVVNRDGIV